MGGEETLAEVAEAELGTEAGAAALPFLEAVAAQLGAPLEVGGRAWSRERELDAARRAARLLRLAAAAPAEGGGPEAAAAVLARDPALAAVFFGNADLLFAAGYPGADAAGMATVQAAWLLGEADAG